VTRDPNDEFNWRELWGFGASPAGGGKLKINPPTINLRRTLARMQNCGGASRDLFLMVDFGGFHLAYSVKRAAFSGQGKKSGKKLCECRKWGKIGRATSERKHRGVSGFHLILCGLKV